MIKISCINEKARKFVIRHCHDEMEINVFLSGQGTYLVNGVEYPVRAGDVFLFHSCMFHCLYNDSGNSVFSIIKIIFDINDMVDVGIDDTLSSILKMFNSNEFMIDGYIFGPCDLSGTLGELGNIYGEKIQNCIRKAIEILKKHGKTIGISLGTTYVSELKFWKDLGINMISSGTDYDFIMRGARDNLRNFREYIYK